MFTQIESIIPNTIMELHESGDFYKIMPADGYKLHAKGFDIEIHDEAGRFVETQKRYTKVFVTCGVNYDFEANPREFYAVEDCTEIDGSAEEVSEDVTEEGDGVVAEEEATPDVETEVAEE